MRAFPPRLSRVQGALPSELMLLRGAPAPSPWGQGGLSAGEGVEPRVTGTPGQALS